MQEKIMNVDGMNCMHCVKAVTKALSAVEGVSDVQVSLEEKCARFKAAAEVSDESLLKAVRDADFEPHDLRTL